MEIAGRDRVNVIGLLRGYSHNAEMRTDRNAHVLEDPVASEVINRLGPVSLSTGVDHVDSDHFARLRLGDQFLLVETPPGGRIRRLNDRPPLFDLRLLKGAQTSGVRCSRGGISIP